jgi:PAS domain S-box-containing protein
MDHRRGRNRSGSMSDAANGPDIQALTAAALSGEDAQSPATLLRIASEISGKVNAILEPDLLLQTVIPLLKEGFDLYYAHVYILDEPRRLLRLRAGYGEAGEAMLAKGHRIPLDAERSLVARAARTREPVVVDDVTAAPDFLANPLLPETLSEMAVPMVVGDEVLGVFDVQHHRKAAFTPSFQNIFFTLAGQVATGLQNARFVERIEHNLFETRTRLEIGQSLAVGQTEAGVLDALVEQAGADGDVFVAVALCGREVEAPTLELARVAAFESGLELSEHAIQEFLLSEIDRASENVIAPDLTRLPPVLKVPPPLELPSALSDSGVESLLVLSLEVGTLELGFLVVASRKPGAFDSRRWFRCRTLAEQGAAALHQAQLRDQLSLTQFSVDRAPVAIMWVRPDGSLHSANNTACELLGYGRRELLSLSSIGALDPNMIPSVWAAHWTRVKQQQRFTIETEYRTKNGRLIPVEVTANYLRYGEDQFNCIYARDVSERKQAESAREHFVVQLRTAAEIAEQVGAILDSDKLLAAVIPLLKERFELYHAHVYLLQEEELLLRAGYGRIGKIMVEQGHRISLHHPASLVARAARSRRPVVVNDTSTAPDFLPNWLLPQTKSEVAVPIVMGAQSHRQVLGVFDVQSDRVNAFSESDVDVLRTLSGLLANALYSAMLFEQQRAMQQELHGSVQTVRAIFDAMTEGIVVTDMVGRILDANEAALRLFKFNSQEKLLGSNVMELVTKPAGARIADNIRLALETGHAEVLEIKMLAQDGNTFDAEQSMALLWDGEGRDSDEASRKGGNPYGVVSITRDITDRQRSRRQIAQFKALAENAVDAILMADFSGHITFANSAAADLLGYPDGLLQRNLASFWKSDEVRLLLEEALPAAGSDGWQGEVDQVRSDGSAFQAALTLFSVRGERGEPLSLALIIRDISERRRNELQLRRFTTQLRTASDVATQVTAMLAPERQNVPELLASVVPLLQERFDLYHVHVYTLDVETGQLIMRMGSGEAGRIMREREHRIALEQEPSLVAQAARTRKTVVVDDVREEPLHLPNPLLPHTRSEIAIPLLVGDEVLGVFDVQDRVPGRFHASEVDVLTALAAQIAIAFRNARYFDEMQSVAERLREIDRLKSEFLANMSHELRTPLNSILGYAEVMLMGIDGELGPEMEEDVQAIFENGQQLLKLINDVLDLTKIEAGRMGLAKERISVMSLLEETRAHTIGLVHKESKSLQINVVAEPDLPPIIADPVRLAQILNNLVSNAVKFTDEGEVRLSAYCRPDMDVVCIEVTDTGAGIASAELAHLFERFHQVDGSSTRRAEGTGLGLAITRRLVELHGGTLAVASTLGEGSTFAVCLPINGEESKG